MEAIAQVEVKVDNDVLDRKYEALFKKHLELKLKMITAKQLAIMYSMEIDTLEDAFFSDPRVKIYERRRGKGKRYWIAEKVIPIMDEIIEYEWL